MEARSSVTIPIDTEAHVRWYVFLRWIVLSIIVIPGLIATYLNEGIGSNFIYDAALGTIALASNGIFDIFSHQTKRSIRYYRTISWIMLIADIMTVTLFMFNKGGIESRSIIMYAIPIMMSAVLLGRRAVYATTAVALLFYHGLIFGEYFGLYRTLHSLTPELHTDTGYVLMSTIFITSLILLLAMTSDFVSRLLFRERQQALQNYETLARAQSIAHIGSWELQPANGSMTWSDEMYRLFNYYHSLITPTTQAIIDTVHPDDRRTLRSTLRRLQKHRTSVSNDFRIYRGHDIRFLHSEARSEIDSRGRVVRVYGIVQDVTELRELDEAKHDFVSLASHQLRTPASVVKQYIGMLLSGYGDRLTPAQTKLAQAAFDGNERQLKLINDLLGVIKIDSGRLSLKKQPTDLVDLIRGIVDTAEPSLKPRKQVILFDCRRQSLICPVDPEYIRISVEHLIENASKYSRDGTKIHVSLASSGRRARISVRDRGIGIHAQDIPKLFRKFSQLDNALSVKADGNGLGLYWVHKITELHRGHIDVESRIGKGTTFHLYLPLAARVVKRAPPKPRRLHAAASHL